MRVSFIRTQVRRGITTDGVMKCAPRGKSVSNTDVAWMDLQLAQRGNRSLSSLACISSGGDLRFDTVPTRRLFIKVPSILYDAWLYLLPNSTPNDISYVLVTPSWRWWSIHVSRSALTFNDGCKIVKYADISCNKFTFKEKSENINYCKQKIDIK